MKFIIQPSFYGGLVKLAGAAQSAAINEVHRLSEEVRRQQFNLANPGRRFKKIGGSGFWSLRANSDIRIVADRSANRLVLYYVDHHDKAYQWADRRKPKTGPTTGATQIIESTKTEMVQEVAPEPEYVVKGDSASDKLAATADELAEATEKPAALKDMSEDNLLRYGVPTEAIQSVLQADEDELLELAFKLPTDVGDALLELADGGKPAFRPVVVGSGPDDSGESKTHSAKPDTKDPRWLRRFRLWRRRRPKIPPAQPDAGDTVVRRADSEAAMPVGGMGKLVADAWAEHEQAAGSCRVDPSIPILFFGDLEEYRRSELRVMTVGFHPSGREFPVDSPFERFPGGTGNDSTQSYLNCLSSYFRVNPYRGWFHQYDAVLDGAQASYYAGKPSTALHTNFVSPIATNPTWGRLTDPQREALLAGGVPLWHRLLEHLRPDIVFLTISRELLAKIEFASRQSDWQSLAVSASAEPGSRPRSHAIDWRWHEIASKPSLFIFDPSSRIPFGLFNHQLKTRIGELAREKFLERTKAAL